jgi:hypothetical protein
LEIINSPTPRPAHEIRLRRAREALRLQTAPGVMLVDSPSACRSDEPQGAAVALGGAIRRGFSLHDIKMKPI